jgi:hypothetical protein
MEASDLVCEGVQKATILIKKLNPPGGKLRTGIVPVANAKSRRAV